MWVGCRSPLGLWKRCRGYELTVEEPCNCYSLVEILRKEPRGKELRYVLERFIAIYETESPNPLHLWGVIYDSSTDMLFSGIIQ
jgi:hypothetical protein